MKTATKIQSPAPAQKSFSLPSQSLLQRECASGGRDGKCDCENQNEKVLQRKSNHDFARMNVTPSSGIFVTQAGDSFEQEAERAADAVMSGQKNFSPGNFANGILLQRDDSDSDSVHDPKIQKPKSEKEKYKDAALKLSEVLRATDAGKKLEAQLAQLGKDFISTPEGKATAGTLLAGALAGLIATNKELPMQIPEIPLDWLSPGLKAKLTWEGPVRTPTKVGLTVTTGGGVSIGASFSDTPASPGKPTEEKVGLMVTIPLGGSSKKKKSGLSDTDKRRAEGEVLKAEQQKTQEGFKTPEQRAEDKIFWDAYWRSKIRDPLKPTKKTDDDLFLMRAAENNFSPTFAPPIVKDVLAESGQPLDATTKNFMESRFGFEFGNVRVHTDARAAQSAKVVHAKAYTVGNHLVFANENYQPGTSAGQRLIAHELVHTIQQGASRANPVLQRYPVPAYLKCGDVVDWLNSNSPYAPEWAETDCNYSFSGNVDVNIVPQKDGSVKAMVKGNNKVSVAVDCPIDRPEWSPSNRPSLAAEIAAWRAMRTTLDAHESQHRQIGQTWRGTLEQKYRAVNFSVTGTDHDDAMSNAQTELSSRQQSWTNDAQAAQSAIDPFRGAVLNCPPATNSTSP